MTDDLISRADAIEAIEWGKTYVSVFDENGNIFHPFELANNELSEAINRIKAIPSAQPNWFEDAIPPKDKEVRINGNGCVFMSAKTFKDIQPKQGEWIYVQDPLRICDEWRCSECGSFSFCKTNYCERCGARMNSSEIPNNCGEQTELQTDDNEYAMHLYSEVVKNHMSDAEAQQAWWEYINHKDEQTERSE